MDSEDLLAVTESLDDVDRRNLDEALAHLSRARGSGDADAVLAAFEDLEERLESLDLFAAAQRLRTRMQPLLEARERADLHERLAPDLDSADPTTRAHGLWRLGEELARSFHDRPAAAAAYREAVATAGPTWVAVAAAMNLAQLLEDDDDLDGAREAYERVVDVWPVLQRSRDEVDRALVASGVDEVAAGRLATLARRRSDDTDAPA